jgi:carbonic anhydrase
MTRKNVHLTIQKLLDRSLILRKQIEAGNVGVVGAMCDVSTGQVEFFD